MDGQKKNAPLETVSSKGEPMALVWEDEFDCEGAPDPAKWGYEEGFVRNRELQYYTRDRRENARIEDGRLVLEARIDNFRHAEGTSLCTSAAITTYGRAAWTYGRFEIRAKVPRGIGTWPAIWMLGENVHEIGWPRCGEIDIMEYVGFQPNEFFFTLHGPDANGGHVSSGSCSRTIPEADGEYAVYALEWDEGGFRYFVNGAQVADFPRETLPFGQWPFDKPHDLLLNLAIGGAWGATKGIDAGIFPSRFEVDYVRVYQKK